MLVASLVTILAVYGVGLTRLWDAAGYGRGIRYREAAAFGIAWITLVAALTSPMHEWSERSLAVHMVQHELLMMVAAPLLAMSAPLIAALWVLPLAARRRALAWVRRPVLSGAWRFATAPFAVWFLHAVVLWTWHLPLLYDAAVAHEAVHVVQHLCFVSAAVMFWWGLSQGRYGRSGYGAAVVYLFATAVQGGILGALLTLSPRVWYAAYRSSHLSGLSPLEDQQLAGLLMWVPAGLIFAAGGLAFFAAWVTESDRRTRFRPVAGTLQ
jgi:putative membrane protein